MKVTITIEDAPGEDPTTTVRRSEDRGDAAAATVTGTPSVTGLPYVKGPNQVAISTNAAGEIVLTADEARSLARSLGETADRAGEASGGEAVQSSSLSLIHI